MSGPGFSLVEAMCWASLTAMLGVTMLSVGSSVRRSEHMARAYSSDLANSRRAVRSLEWDLRLARRVETVGRELRVHGTSGVVRYTLSNGELRRGQEQSSRVVARRIRAFSAKQSGRTVDLRIALMPRRENAPEAAVRTTVLLRNGGRP